MVRSPPAGRQTTCQAQQPNSLRRSDAGGKSKCCAIAASRSPDAPGPPLDRGLGEWASHAFPAVKGSRLKRVQNKVGTFRNPNFWQNQDFVAERRISFEQARIFGQCHIQSVTPFRIYLVNLRPRRRQEHAPMVTVSLTERSCTRLPVMSSSAAAASISPLSKNTQPSNELAAARSARAIAMARRAKATRQPREELTRPSPTLL